MNAAGIISIRQIASPDAETQKALEGFAKIKGSDGWQAQAKSLLG
jgi:predicted flap endonuclease-1-like 5' DNA nuclease